ncbi:hypothetical protein [Pleomorphovibrio marinus]|uniref:hypothetical protein n=1 Tax=Pleomorphovibrio marinus TaxID=2164132 RepID=UPI000E0A6AFA|nr:hypothetical protein [Pleomorphovibrio marinus]
MSRGASGVETLSGFFVLPKNFGVLKDENLLAELPIWAPEIIQEDGLWFISDLGDFQGVMLAKLKWEE